MIDFVFLVSFLLVPLIVPASLAFISACTQIGSAQSETFRYPKFFVYLPLVFCGMVIAGTIIDLTHIGGSLYLTDNGVVFYTTVAQNIFAAIALPVMTLLGIILILYRVCWRLVLDEEVLIFRNLLGITKIYKYTEITRIRIIYIRNAKTPEKYLININKVKIVVDYLQFNFNNFERLIKKRLKKAKNPIEFEVIRTKVK